MKNVLLVVLYLVLIDLYFTYVISSDLFSNNLILLLSIVMLLLTFGFVKILIKINKK